MQKISMFSVWARVWVVVFTLYQTLKQQSCFDSQKAMPCLSGLDRCPVTRSFERLQSLTPTLWTVFSPACWVFSPSLSLSLSLNSVQAGGRSDSTFPHSSNYSFCSDGTSHTFWFVFTRRLQGIMEMFVSTACVCACYTKISPCMTGIVMMNVKKYCETAWLIKRLQYALVTVCP